MDHNQSLSSWMCHYFNDEWIDLRSDETFVQYFACALASDLCGLSRKTLENCVANLEVDEMNVPLS